MLTKEKGYSIDDYIILWFKSLCRAGMWLCLERAFDVGRSLLGSVVIDPRQPWLLVLGLFHPGARRNPFSSYLQSFFILLMVAYILVYFFFLPLRREVPFR